MPDRTVLSGPTMGTTWAVTLNTAGRGPDDVDAARTAIDRTLVHVNALMSNWDPESEISHLNRHAGPGPFVVSPETFAVLELAQQVSAASEGAFDVTVGPLVAAWGFGVGARTPGDDPSPAELAALRARVGWRQLTLDPRTRGVTKARPDVEIDLSAIAKGFGVDAVARALDGLGWRDYFVEIGGEVRVRGERPGGGPWRVGIERPADDPGEDVARRRVQGVIEIGDRALATSGDYRNVYVQAGERRAHFIDPRTGRPAAHAPASVSVLADAAMVADAWATALSVLGPDEGFALAESEGLAAWFILRGADGGFEVRATAGFPEVRDPRAAGADEAPTD